MTTSQRSSWGSTWQRLTQLPPKLLLVIPGVQASQECQEGQDVYCGRCVQRMFVFPAGPAAPSRDIGVKGHSGQRVGTIKRSKHALSKHWATDTQVYFQTFKNMVRWKVFGCLWNSPLISKTGSTYNSTAQGVSLKSLWSSEKYPPDKEESTETEASSFSPCFWQCSLDRLPAKATGLKKFFSLSQQIWCHQWFIMLSGVQYVYRKLVLLLWLERRRWWEQLVAQNDLVSYLWTKTLPSKLELSSTL